MTTLPILFDFSTSVIGSGFATVVSFQGAALFRKEEEGEFWADGVYPGAIAAGGSSMAECYLQLRENINNCLLDMASQYSDYPTFKTAVTKFYEELDPETDAEFTAARESVRNGEVESDMRRIKHPRFSIAFRHATGEPGQLVPNIQVPSEETLAA